MTILIKGPWAVVLPTTDVPETSQYSVSKDGFETQYQAETFIRKNLTKEEARRAFPVDVRTLCRPEDKVDAKFKTMEEVEAFVAHVTPGSGAKN